MLKGMLGKKIGMTQIFQEDGELIPVTAVELGPLYVLRVLKETEKKGHPVNALELGFDVKREIKAGLKEKFGEEFDSAKALRLTKPLYGHYKKAGFEKKFGFVRQVAVENPDDYEVGSVLTLEDFNIIKKVDVKALSKGRGFAGPIKRHGQKTGRKTHGSRFHRKPGSMGPSAWPARVFPGKKLAGHMGNSYVTVRNLEVVRIDKERNIVLVKGAVPGPNGAYVLVNLAR